MMSAFLRQRLSLSLFLPSFMFFITSDAVSLELCSGGLTKLTNPLHISKLTTHSPVFRNLHAKLGLHPPILPSLLPKLPSLPTVLPPILPPLIPGLPFIPHLPLLPPVIPPLLPAKLGLPKPLLTTKLGLTNPPILPISTKLGLRQPSLLPLTSKLGLPKPPLLPIAHKLDLPGFPGRLGRKLELDRALGSVKPIKLPIKPMLGREWKPDALDILKDLKRNGHLTTAEYFRFKRLLPK